MSIKRINEFPEGSGSLSNDDIFLFMDDPNGGSVTKKISLSEISAAIGGGGGGGTNLQITTVDLHNGGVQNAQVLKFDNPSYQSVITGPTPTENSNAQRIIIQGPRASGNGEGGDVYLWGGDSDVNGGDIKIYAGDADSNESGQGGYINIDAGNGYNNGGNIGISAGNSTENGGNVTISAGTGSTNGIVTVQTSGSNYWNFNSDGSLDLPQGKTISWGQNNDTLGSPQQFGGTDRIRLWDFDGGGTGFNYAIGVEPNHVWFAMDVNNGEGGFKFYSRDTQIFKISDDSKLIFPNTSQLSHGTFDNSTNSASGISLTCTAGYELNWQGGHLKNTTNNGASSTNILCDSSIEFPGNDTDNMEINSAGLTFPNGTTQSSAGIVSNTGVVNNSSAINNIVQISQANYDSLGSYDSNTLYIING